MKITAKHKRTGKSVDMEFVSIAQASFFNPEFTDFVEKGFADKKHSKEKK